MSIKGQGHSLTEISSFRFFSSSWVVRWVIQDHWSSGLLITLECFITQPTIWEVIKHFWLSIEFSCVTKASQIELVLSHTGSYFGLSPGLSPGHINYLATSMNWVIKHLYHTFLGDSQNYQPLGAVDHVMNYHPWPSSDSSSGGPQHLGADSFDCCPERYKMVLYYHYGVSIHLNSSAFEFIQDGAAMQCRGYFEF